MAYLSFAKSSQRLSGSLSHCRGILDFTLTWIRCRGPLTTNLVFVKLCRELGITPAVFFGSQLKDAFKDFQRSVVYLLREYQCKIFEIQNMGQAQCIRSNECVGSFDYQGNLRDYLGPITHRARDIMKTLYVQSKLSPESDQYITEQWMQLKTRSGHPLLLFCVDEARGLSPQ